MRGFKYGDLAYYLGLWGPRYGEIVTIVSNAKYGLIIVPSRSVIDCESYNIRFSDGLQNDIDSTGKITNEAILIPVEFLKPVLPLKEKELIETELELET